MTRKSRREIERELDGLRENQGDRGRPFDEAEQRRLAAADVDVAAWGQTPTRRAVLRSLVQAAEEVA